METTRSVTIIRADSSPEKNFVREEGKKTFIYPDQLSLSFVYVF